MSKQNIKRQRKSNIIEDKDGYFKITFDNLEQFYKECDILEETGNDSSSIYYKHSETDACYRADFIGLPRDELLKSKYVYKKGLDELSKLDLDLDLGGHKRSYKWDENDGDDMDYDRYLDNLSCLKKRIHKEGLGQGKIINIHVSVGENCGVSYKEMLYRSYTVMKVIDSLEEQGYRIGVFVYTDVAELGWYKSETIKMLHTEIQIKKPEEPLIKGLILTCISPWMLRYYFFKFWSAKFKCRHSLGSSREVQYKEDRTNIYFTTGSCLNEDSAKCKIDQLKELFSFED